MVENHEASDGLGWETRSTRLVEHDLNIYPAVPTQFERQRRDSSIPGRQSDTTTLSNGHVRHKRSISNNHHREQRRKRSSNDSVATANTRGNRHRPVDMSVASNSKLPVVTGERLDKLIFERMVKSADRNTDARFMPMTELDSTISPANVQHELDLRKNRRKLTKLRNRSPQLKELSIDSAHLARVICRKPSRRKIFAILCYINKAYAILSFIGESVTDRDLPLRFDDELSGVVLRKRVEPRANGMVNEEIKLFADRSWPRHDLESFKGFQWRFLAPVFFLSYELGQHSKHQNLEPSSILPFVEDAPEAASLSQSVALEGGFSFVRKVRIHQAHHNHWKNPKYRGVSYFAVKKLKTQPAQGLNEVRSLLRFNEQPHEHLIRLLSTFIYKDNLNMIFHWADGNNLENFWVQTKATAKDDFVLTRWVSKQISGLAEAIQRIHHCDDRLLPKPDKGKTHGRHGDLKPANILWFRYDPNETSPGSHGILKISDFGMADFHGPLSKSNIPADQVVGLTNGYRAPEFDNTRLVSPRYDIWSFGCVLLEFAVWRTIGGYKRGVNHFSKLRTKESTAVIPEDNFFNLRSGNKEEIIEAVAKRSVINMFQRVRSHQSCTGFIRDLLECVEQDLLQLEPNDRATCTAVMDKLQAINERCNNDQEYCVATVRITRNDCPSGLADPVLMDFSDRMKENLNLRTIDFGSERQNQPRADITRTIQQGIQAHQANLRWVILMIVFTIITVLSALVLIRSIKPSEQID